MTRRARPLRGGRPARRTALRRLLDLVLAVAVLAALALVASRFGGGETVTGTARAADGDSLAMASLRIRLEGIDAPELAQSCTRDGGDWPCGRLSRDALARLVDGRVVSCEGRGHDHYGRLLARCTAGGVDLNRAMVEEGWALAYGGYEVAEAAARLAGRGMWAGSFERPQDWRRIHGGMAEEAHGGLFAWLRGIWYGWLRD